MGDHAGMSKLTALLRGRGLGGVVIVGGALAVGAIAGPPVWHALAQAAEAPAAPQPPTAMQPSAPRAVPADPSAATAPAASPAAPGQAAQPGIIDSILGKANQLANQAADGSLGVKAAVKLLTTNGP